MSDDALILGFDVGGTKSAVLVGDAAGRVLARSEFRTEAARGPDPMIADMLSAAAALRREHVVRRVGVSIGGPLDAQRGIILGTPNLPGWNRVPLKDILERELALPVRVEHDAAACALAEYRWGGGAGAQRLIYLTCGTGFGAGFVFDGRVYSGAAGMNVELGHMIIADDGPVAFGQRGSAEALCAGQGLGRIAAWLFPERWGKNPPASAEISRLVAAGDADARNVTRRNAQSVGRVCAILGDMLRPDLIMLGSLATYLGPPWVEMVRAQFAAEALPASSAACRIMPASLGSRLQDLSALVVALEESV